MRKVDVRQATHVQIQGRIEKIVETWGIDADGRLAKPSEGGFGVITAGGERVDMWEADAYLLEEPETNQDPATMELYAWVGWDEYGSGELGLKQGITPAGTIPMVSISQIKLDKYWEQAETLARQFGKRIFLVRFRAVEVIRETRRGDAQ